jgi:hypothetical protein
LDARPAGSSAGQAIDRQREEGKQMSMKLVSFKDYVAGWVDGTMHDFLEVLPAKAASIKYALITCLDSNRDPASLRQKSPELKGIAKRLQILGNGLLLPTELLIETDSERQLFFGFDEVWFFPTKTIAPKPEAASLVGPARVNQARFNRIARWMSDNSCSLALGGGAGLNFVVRAQGLAKLLLGCSLEQPEPLALSETAKASLQIARTQ